MSYFATHWSATRGARCDIFLPADLQYILCDFFSTNSEMTPISFDSELLIPILRDPEGKI